MTRCFHSVTGNKDVILLDFNDSFTYNVASELLKQEIKSRVIPKHEIKKTLLKVLEKNRKTVIVYGPGPGHPDEYAMLFPLILKAIESPFIYSMGICLGHQMLALALGAKTVKMNHGHHGANHPVKDLDTGKVEITSMNHGFAVDSQTLPEGVVETHVSLFDGSNCGLRMETRPVFSVQYHPEASPGPMDSYYLFERFVEAMQKQR